MSALNPLDLRGPEFLVFYLALGLVVLVLLVLARLRLDARDLGRIRLSDPYLIACLRGGPPEALRVASISLVDRGLLRAHGGKVKTVNPAVVTTVSSPLEKAILKRFDEPRDAASIYHDTDAQTACTQMERTLAQCGLLPDDELKQQRRGLAILAIATLWSVAFIKVVVALSRGRSNVVVLLLLAGFAAVWAAKLASPRRTGRGEEVLSDLGTLFAGLKTRHLVRDAAHADDAVMLAAVFGLAALPPAWSYVPLLYPKASKASSSGSSCGSSCGSCGSSCGGGGCGGGCGGCGS
jgi:uncharacterized protein (TIGR04222 family)